MMYHSFSNTTPRGFTLLIAMIFVAVILSVGLTLSDVSYKQVILASTARQSEYAFYNADSAIECALELDQQYDAFDILNEYTGTFSSATYYPQFDCEGNSLTITAGSANMETGSRTSTFSIPCTPAGTAPEAQVTVIKYGAPDTNGRTTYFYANGFNDCNASDPQRVERGLKSQY